MQWPAGQLLLADSCHLLASEQEQEAMRRVGQSPGAGDVDRQLHRGAKQTLFKLVSTCEPQLSVAIANLESGWACVPSKQVGRHPLLGD